MASEEKTRLTIDIFGTQYKLMGKSSSGYMKMVAAHVNEQMYKIADSNPRLDAQRIAVLAAVNMADEFMKMKAEMESLQGEWGKSQQLKAAFQKLQDERNQLTSEYKQIHNRLQLQEQEGLKAREEIAQWKKRMEEQERQFENEQNERKKLEQEKEQLLQEYEQLKRLLDEQISQQHRRTEEETAIYEEYRKLKEEYKMLQSEYNEWIELVEKNNEG